MLHLLANVAKYGSMGVLALAASLGAQSRAMAQIGVPEIPNPLLPDIAVVKPTPSGPVIIYNPRICAEAGPYLCSFFRWHEYGHIILGHAYTRNWPQVQEFEADCWAAANAPPMVVSAAVQFFLNGGGSTPIHGSSYERARRLQACYGR